MIFDLSVVWKGYCVGLAHMGVAPFFEQEWRREGGKRDFWPDFGDFKGLNVL